MAASVLTLVLLLFGLLALGVPVALAVGAAAAITLLVSTPLEPGLVTIAQRMATSLDSFALLAIPLFILSGHLLNRGGAARRLIDLGRALVGRSPAGLLYVNILACLLFGAISGSAVAAAAAIGAFLVPLAARDGIPKELTAAVNITASTTGLLVPPSNILIVYALASGGVSIAALFAAGYVPGILLAVGLGVVTARMGRRLPRPSNPDATPPIGTALLAAAPSLGLIVLVMGGIVAGIFTATEAAGIAVVYSLLLVLFVHRGIGVGDLRQIVVEAASTTGVVLFLVATSMALSWVMAFEGLPQAIATSILGLASNEIVVLLVINLLLLVAGTFMDMTPAVLIFTPILLPVVEQLGVHPVHFGILMVLNLCIGLCTPPVGTVLFVGTGVAGLELREVVPKLWPLYAAMLVTLLLLTLVPELTLWLPRSLGLI